MVARVFICLAFATALPGAETPTAVNAELATVRAQVAALKLKFGAQAGEPEVADKYEPIPKTAPWLSAAEAQAAIVPALQKIEKIRWWQPGLDPTTLTHAL